MMNAILQNNLRAEFPFEVSTVEYEIIKHFDSSTLTLGRSGTGKTTCLVFKMVKNYLATNAISDAPPLKTVLMTRSKFLAPKLREQTCRLIEGHTSRRLQSKLGAKPEDSDWSNNKEAVVATDIYSISIDAYPLVCTFTQFLQLLERSVYLFGGVNFVDDPEGSKFIRSRDLTLHYWPSFPLEMTRSKSASMVLPEILGIIKGSK